LSSNDWVREGESLDFSGLTLVYQSNTEQSPKAGSCQIKISDDLGNFNTIPVGANGIFTLTMEAKVTDSNINYYRFSILPTSADKTSQAPFKLKIDADLPGNPANFEFHADSPTDISINADNDDTIYLSWSSSVETGSGIKGYYYGRVGGTPTFTTDTGGQVTGLTERAHSFEVYCEDNVGNIGGKSTVSIIIDMTDPVFVQFTPNETEWVNNTPLECSMKAIDWKTEWWEEGSGIDTDSIQYSVKKSGSDEWGTWQRPDSIDVSSARDPTPPPFNFITANKELDLPEGSDNYIKWRVSDIAGNGPVESPPISVMVDTTSVIFTGFTPYYSTSRDMLINLTLIDTSGVRTCEYRLALTGEDDYGAWQKAAIINIDGQVQISIPMTLPFGSGHRIQFRADDIAGNGRVLSEEFRIRVNSVPNVVITSPLSTETYMTSDWLEFNASDTSDEDNDSLNYRWESDLMGEIGTGSRFNLQLTPGKHNIVLRVSDEGGHIVNTTFKLTILPVDTDGDGIDDSEDTDDDGDGMPDYWELMYDLDPLKNDAQDDKDDDGFTNKEEYNAGTDPSDPDSHPKGLSGATISSIIFLNIIMLIFIIALVFGFILYRRHIRKKLIIPEVVSKPGAPALPAAEVGAGALPGGKHASRAGAELTGIQPQLQLPKHTMTSEEILYQLDQRFVLGEISEETYKELKDKYKNVSVNEEGARRVTEKKKKRLSLPPKSEEN
ncbi:MAG: fibronectin type III domain-containing protein, partial [Thermoplasmata archaeon]